MRSRKHHPVKIIAKQKKKTISKRLKAAKYGTFKSKDIFCHMTAKRREKLLERYKEKSFFPRIVTGEEK